MASGDENKKPDAGKVGGGDKKEEKKKTKEERKKEEEMVMGILPAIFSPAGQPICCCLHPPHGTFPSHLDRSWKVHSGSPPCPHTTA